MRRWYAELFDALRARLLHPDGRLPVALRSDIVEGRLVDGPLGPFVARVRERASIAIVARAVRLAGARAA